MDQDANDGFGSCHRADVNVVGIVGRQIIERNNICRKTQGFGSLGSKTNHQLVLAARNKRRTTDLLRQNVAKLGYSAPRRP